MTPTTSWTCRAPELRTRARLNSGRRRGPRSCELGPPQPLPFAQMDAGDSQLHVDALIRPFRRRRCKPERLRRSAWSSVANRRCVRRGRVISVNYGQLTPPEPLTAGPHGLTNRLTKID